MPHRMYGSVHPHDRKKATARLATTTLERPPKYIVLPMTMHMGEPCTPIVAVGDQVLLGQKIARPNGPGAPIHTSVSGTVTAVEPRPVADGTPVLSVVVENDFRETPVTPPEQEIAPAQLTGWEIADRVEEAGVVGLGGGCFPTAIKLRQAIGHVDTLILNGTECEPYITADHRLMLEAGERVIGGTELLMQALGLDKAVIAVESSQITAAEHLRSLLPPDSGIQVRVLKARYPQGAEQPLIRTLTGRSVPSGKGPVDVQCAVFNIATAAAVHDAVVRGLPLTHRIVTVSGGAVREPRNLLVPIGTPLSHLLAECGGLVRKTDRVLLGGPMMGRALSDLDTPATKGTNALLFLTRKECAPLPAQDPACIRCGRCQQACPMKLSPLFFDLYRRKGRFGELEALGVMDCIECGACAYVCPSHIQLVRSIRAAKKNCCAARHRKRSAANTKERRLPFE